MDQVRNLFCVHYPMCLDMHLRCSKRKFTCAGCQRYKPIHLETEDIVEDGVRCGELLNALFFGVDCQETKARGKVKRSFSDDELVAVPARLLRGLVSSFSNGMYSFGGTSILIKKLDEILKQGKPDEQLANTPSGDTGEEEPGAAAR